MNVANTNRDQTFDVVKGVAIILMVAAHAMSTSWPIHRWILLFHMPVFFVLAGWFYSSRHADSFGAFCAYCRKRVLRLWVPWVVWGGLFVLLHDCLIYCHVYSMDPNVFGIYYTDAFNSLWGWTKTIKTLLLVPLMRAGQPGVLGAIWFLKVLFFATLFYALSDLVLSKCIRDSGNEKWRIIGLTVFAVVSFALARYFFPVRFRCYLEWVGGVRMLTAYGLIHVGVLLRYFNLQLTNARATRLVIIAAVTALFLVFQWQWGKISLGTNTYSSVIRLLACSIAGWYMLEALSRLIILQTNCGRILSYIGMHTMPILIFHILAFKVASLGGIILYGLPLDCIGAIPCSFYSVGWCFIYTIIGVCLPICLWPIWDFFIGGAKK